MVRKTGLRDQRLNGLNILAYMGVNSFQPPEVVTEKKSPGPQDKRNFQLGTIWIDVSSYPISPTISNVYILVSLANGVASWASFEGDNIITLTGNTGGEVSPDVAQNIDIIGDDITLTVSGNPGTHALTISLVGTGVLSTITGNSGGAVGPTSGEINIVGSGVITVVGNPGTSTLTIVPSDSIADSFDTDPATGTAIPFLGLITFEGTNGIVCSASGSTITLDGTGLGNVASLQAGDSNIVTPTAGIIEITGASNIATTGTVGPNTLTVNLDGITQYSVQVGGAGNSLTQIPNGTTGQVLTATTGGDPFWQTNAATYGTGTFDAQLRFGGSNTGITYFTKQGYYNRIADVVFYSIYLGLSNKGSATGDATVINLPFTVKNDSSIPEFHSQVITNGFALPLSVNYDFSYFSTIINTTTANLYQFGSGQVAIPLTEANFNNNTDITIQGWYQLES